MNEVPPDLAHRLRLHRQEHVVADWGRLAPEQRLELVGQLAGIDLAQLDHLFTSRDETYSLPARDQIAPLPVEDPSSADAALGEDEFRAGRVAALVVAGGQGSRLGFERPKGMFPLGPVSNATLFQMHAEKVLALSRRYGRAIPFLVMTSPATHDETVAFFDEHKQFGLAHDQVMFFRQGTMPSLDLRTGKLLLERPGVIFTSPNGHGGTLTALNESGLLDDLRLRGIRHIYYFQVDNPLVKIGDTAFLGAHARRGAEVSLKVIEKDDPHEKMGVFALVGGRCAIIEYIDMPADLNERRDGDGGLTYRAANPAIHLFDLGFLERITRRPSVLPFHVARKKVPYLGPEGVTIEPSQPNALKFEMFIFDALPAAERWLAVRTTRREEFAPLKNGDGADSPATAKRAILDLAADWLRSAGITPKVPVEVSPLFALDADELRRRLPVAFAPTEPTYLTE